MRDRLGEPRPHQREHGALRILAARDPGTWHFERTFEDSAAANLHPLRRGIDVADAEIEQPERELHHRRLSEHTAKGLPADRHELIVASFARFGAAILPAEKRVVERHRLSAVSGKQLMPADAA